MLLAGCDASESGPSLPVSRPYVHESGFDLAGALGEGICIGTNSISTGGFECHRLAGGVLHGTRTYFGPSFIQVSEPARTWWAPGAGGWYSWDDTAAPATVSGNLLVLGNAGSDAFLTQATVTRIALAGRDIRVVLADFDVAGQYDLDLTASSGDTPVPAGARFPAGAFAYRLERRDLPAGARLPVIAGSATAVGTSDGSTVADLDAMLVAFAENNAAGNWLNYATIYSAAGGPPGTVVPWGEYEAQFRSDGTAVARLRWLDSQPVQAQPDLTWSKETVAGSELLRLDVGPVTERNAMRWLRGSDAPWYTAAPGGKYWMASGGKVFPAIVSPPRADLALHAFNPVAAAAVMPYFVSP